MTQNSHYPSSNGDLPLLFLHRPAAPDTAEPWLLVLMHGVGSHEEDLFGLADGVPARFHVVSLRAPFALARDAFAWFVFDVLPGGARRIDTTQEAASRAAVAQTVNALAEQLGVPPARTVLGGFSQGGIMALSLLRTRPGLLAGALVLHSRLLPEVDALAAPPHQLAGKALWVSHGLQDEVIPLASARAIRDRLAATPVALTYREFPGGHGIHPDELRAAMAWLDGLSPG
jgi:phospholipase/carboxylesterase